MHRCSSVFISRFLLNLREASIASAHDTPNGSTQSQADMRFAQNLSSLSGFVTMTDKDEVTLADVPFIDYSDDTDVTGDLPPSAFS